MPTRKTIRAAKRSLSRELLQNPGVSGVGIGHEPEGEYIRVYLAEDSPEVRSQVPDSVEGYPVVVETIGSIQAQPAARGTE